jgi:hypothetical protein
MLLQSIKNCGLGAPVHLAKGRVFSIFEGGDPPFPLKPGWVGGSYHQFDWIYGTLVMKWLSTFSTIGPSACEAS